MKRNQNLVFNMDLFNQKIKENGFSTKKDFTDKLGMHHSTIYRWQSGLSVPSEENLILVCKALKIKKTELFIKEDKLQKQKEQVQEKKEPAKKEKFPFKELETKNIDQSFATINENILSLANLVKSLQSDLSKAYLKIEDLEKKREKEISTLVSSPNTKKETKKSYLYGLDELINGYKEEDSLPVWKEKIITMVKIHSHNTELTFKKILSEIYGHMTKVYGVCWEQERKEIYYDTKTPPSNLEVAYNNKMYRSIMYSLLVDKIAN